MRRDYLDYLDDMDDNDILLDDMFDDVDLSKSEETTMSIPVSFFQAIALVRGKDKAHRIISSLAPVTIEIHLNLALSSAFMTASKTNPEDRIATFFDRLEMLLFEPKRGLMDLYNVNPRPQMDRLREYIDTMQNKQATIIRDVVSFVKGCFDRESVLETDFINKISDVQYVWKHIIANLLHKDSITAKYENLLDKAEQIRMGDKKNRTSSSLDRVQFMQRLYNHLKRSVVGQDHYLKTLAVCITDFKYSGKKAGENSVLLVAGGTGTGKTFTIQQLQQFEELGMPISFYDASRLSGVGYDGDSVMDIFKNHRSICRRSSYNSKRSILYIDEIDKIISRSTTSSGENANAAVQQQLLSSLAGTESFSGIDTSNVLIILGGCFSRIEDELQKNRSHREIGFAAKSANTHIDIEQNTMSDDEYRTMLEAIGGETEFIGRIQSIIHTNALTRDTLSQIYDRAYAARKKEYGAFGLDLVITHDAKEAILDQIEKKGKTYGARELASTISHYASGEMIFDLIESNAVGMKITSASVADRSIPPIYIFENDTKTDREMNPS